MRASSSLGLRLILVAAATTTALMVAMGLYRWHQVRQTLNSSLQNTLQSASKRLETGLPAALWNFDGPQISAVLEAEMEEVAFLSLEVKDVKGKWLAGWRRDDQGRPVRSSAAAASDGEVLERALSFIDNGQASPVGKVSIRFGREKILQTLRHEALQIAAETLIVNVCLVLVYLSSLRLVLLARLNQLNGAMRQIASGEADLTSRLEAGRNDEIGELAGSFNRFVEQLAGIVTQVHISSSDLSEKTGEIAMGNLDLSNRTENQAESLRRTAGAAQDLSVSARRNTDSAATASRVVAQASEIAQFGGAAVKEVVRVMQAITASSSRIGDITGVIDSIAFQTNILALNAAVEAARAGEHGRGFAVVAAEVRELAGRAGSAAKEIKGLIQTSAAEIQAGNRLALESGETMDKVIVSIRQITELMQAIAQASQEQSSRLEQILEDVHRMDLATQQNAALVEESAAAATAMRSLAENLVRVVSRFKLTVPSEAPG